MAFRTELQLRRLGLVSMNIMITTVSQDRVRILSDGKLSLNVRMSMWLRV
jgi:hypothetical protein